MINLRYVLTLLLAVSVYTVLPTPAHALTCTNQQTPSVSIPTGYGASYNPLTSAREYLVSVACGSGTTGTVTAGNGNPLTYVYNRGYYYSGTTWTPYTLTCASGALISGAWCPGRATASIPLPQNPTNVIAYTCQYTNNTWKCGCRDATCSTAYWQLQRVGVSEGTTPTTAGRILHTNFSGLTPNFTGYSGYTPSKWPPPNTVTSASASTYAARDVFYYTGHDATTGQTFSKYEPQLWGGYRTRSPDYGSISYSTTVGVASRATAGEPYLSPTQVISPPTPVSGISGPPGTGITTAFHAKFSTTQYRAPDQGAWTIYPNTDLPQGLLYQRFWIKLMPGFWSSFDSFRTLTGWKGRNNINRGIITFVKDDGVSTRTLRAEADILGDDGPGPWTMSGLINKQSWSDGYNTNQFYAWDSFTYGNAGKRGYNYAGKQLQENVWYKIEFATKASKGSDGFLWAALDGETFLSYQGPLIHAGSSDTKLDRVFLFATYANINRADPGYLITGMEVWETWPADASPHPNLN